VITVIRDCPNGETIIKKPRDRLFLDTCSISVLPRCIIDCTLQKAKHIRVSAVWSLVRVLSEGEHKLCIHSERALFKQSLWLFLISILILYISSERKARASAWMNVAWVSKSEQSVWSALQCSPLFSFNNTHRPWVSAPSLAVCIASLHSSW